MSQPEVQIPGSPVVPAMVDGSTTIQFSCHKGIGCWNACCANIDISLTPYDVLRLKRRLNLSAAEFLKQYTVPYELEKDGIAGVKFRPIENGTACQFMRPEGCSVYEDRPTACRYYPVALLSMRKQDEYVDRDSFALVEEPHCKGHLEPRKLTIDEYRAEQGVVEYDELARGWRQLILKKKSSGPSIGKPSLKSRQLFFMACYDLDTGQLRWSYETQGRLLRLLEAGPNILGVEASPGHVELLDAQTGQVLLRVPPEWVGQRLVDAAVSDGVACVLGQSASDKNLLAAFRLDTGERMWGHPSLGEVKIHPFPGWLTDSPHLMYLMVKHERAAEYRLITLDKRTGRKAGPDWRIRLPGQASTGPWLQWYPGRVVISNGESWWVYSTERWQEEAGAL